MTERDEIILEELPDDELLDILQAATASGDQYVVQAVLDILFNSRRHTTPPLVHDVPPMVEKFVSILGLWKQKTSEGEGLDHQGVARRRRA